MNQIQVIGNLTRDPELKYPKGDKAVCNFTLAVNRRFKAADGIRPTDYFEVTVWEKRGEALADLLKKGMRVFVRGEMQFYTYTNKDGEKHHKHRIVLDSGFDALEILSRKRDDAAAEEYNGDDLPFPAEGEDVGGDA